MDAARRAAGWRAALSDPQSDVRLSVAEIGGAVIGFTAFGPATHAAFGGRGEIKQLYVDPARQGAGLGRRLIAVAAQGLAAQGHRACGLAVVAGNDRALALYLRLGGRDAGGFVDAGPLWKSSNRLIIWDDVGALAQNAAAPLGEAGASP